MALTSVSAEYWDIASATAVWAGWPDPQSPKTRRVAGLAVDVFGWLPTVALADRSLVDVVAPATVDDVVVPEAFVVHAPSRETRTIATYRRNRLTCSE